MRRETTQESSRPWDREILRLAVPALGALAAEPLYVLVDTAIVGHLGTPQLGGLGVASALILSGYWLFAFLAYGTTGTVSRLLGAGEQARAAAQGVQGLWLAVGLGVAVGALGLAFAGPLVSAIGPSDIVRPFALDYFRISMLGVPALLVVLAGSGYLRGVQDTRTPLVVTVATVVANTILELAFVYGFDWGIAGSAWGTVLAQTAGAAWYVRIVARTARAEGASLRPDSPAIRRLARLSVDLIVRTAALRAALLVTTAVVSRLGTIDIAAQQVVFEIWMFLALVLDAIAIAGQAIAGRLLGAGDADRARAATRRMLQLSIVTGATLAMVVIATHTLLPHLFTDDDRVADLAAFVLLFVAVQQPANAVTFALDGILIGAGDLRFLALAMTGAAAVYVPAVLLVLWSDAGIGWVWAAFSLFQLLRLVALALRWRGDQWLVTGAER
jgi:putative MATE family efflux protein